LYITDQHWIPMNRTKLGLLCAALLLVSCGRDTTGPDDRVQLSVLAGDLQFGLPGAELAEPFQAMVVDALSRKPEEGVTVQWQVTTGSGTVVPASSTTDERGLASARLRLGSQLGSYRVEASAPRQSGSAAAFTAEAVLRPEILSIAPGAAAAGQTVVITGANFNPQVEYNAVRFDRIRGRVLSATTTRIEVVVPSCVPSRTVAVDVLVGSVASTTMPFAATGTPGALLALEPGQARFIADPNELSCLRLPGGIPVARYALIAQNAATVDRGEMRFELATFSGSTVTAQGGDPQSGASLTAAEAFELRLRLRERDWVAAAAELRAAVAAVAAQPAEPEVGDRRTFKVLNSEDESVSVTAEITAVSGRAILYQDLAAPTGGFTTADFTRFGELFDDPIYDTDEQVFGTPSDIDGNGRIIILFTPRVNALTRRGESSFIAGYFYGCDLVERTKCTDSNRGEIFYSLVPDPQGKFGDARTTSTVFRAVQPVLAHELQHMINFAHRDQTLDALWLSEALAHTAEDVVGDVFAARGDALTAREFQRTNYARASRFLSALSDVSLIAEETPGTLELRGGAWLFLRHLRAHYGGNVLLGKLTRTALSSTQNVTAQTGESWSRLLSDFAVALYHSSLAPPAVQPAEPRHTFGSLPVRAGILSESGAFPLVVGPLAFNDGSASDALRPAATSILQLTTPATSTYPPVNLVFSGALGGPFIQGSGPQLTIFRVR
jgi:hypothetical protein